jgi:hypothetical protein
MVTVIEDPLIRLAIRPGDVATILTEVARRWHAEVEPLDLPGEHDEWGWAFRPVRGKSSGYSNHASATAIDLNATRHPRGVPVSDTLTSAQVSRIRAILASMYDKDYGASIVRWGGDYKTSPPDAMHFEIANGVTPAMASRVADRITSKYVESTEGDDMKATDPVRLGPANAETLGQSDHVMTYEETVAVNTAESVRTNELLRTLISEIRGLRQDIGGSK